MLVTGVALGASEQPFGVPGAGFKNAENIKK